MQATLPTWRRRSRMPASAKRIRRLVAEANEDDRRAARREMPEHRDDERPPERQVAAQLVRIALDREAAERQATS